MIEKRLDLFCHILHLVAITTTFIITIFIANFIYVLSFGPTAFAYIFTTLTPPTIALGPGVRLLPTLLLEVIHFATFVTHFAKSWAVSLVMTTSTIVTNLMEFDLLFDCIDINQMIRAYYA